ncbi:MAG: hypothetical protein SGJ27_14515 [Candidatus Melainabacteria bacterium]|nr:hypothetical protein [Candidatus Melainabacteria bacterium]
MDQVLLNLKKRILVPAVILVGLCAWLILCHAHYKSYWFGTIYRVQTTDFNLMHHVLPQTLSQMIIAGRSDLIQETLDSSFGLFGLVITDPSGKTVLWKTGKVYHRESWHRKATPELLSSEVEPFDLLTNPVELEPVYAHQTPRSMKAKQLRQPKGQVLGRLYYLRADPPAFWSDIQSFVVGGFWEVSGAKRGYLYVTISVVAFSLVVLLVFWLRRRSVELKQNELEHAERELEIRRKALENLSNELASQKSRKAWLEKEADQAYRRAVGLKKSLEKLRDSILGLPAIDGDQSRNRNEPIRVRPPTNPSSHILDEIESLLPALNENAKVLRHQAGVLHDYCSTLEGRQQEMQRIVDHAYSQTMPGANMSPNAPQGQAQPEMMDMTPR